MPWYRSSVFSRTITRSTPSCRVGTPGRDRAGRMAANRSRSCRSATLTLRNPPPTGVVIGPLIATRQSRIASSVCSGSSAPSVSRAPAPAGISIHSIPTSAASSTTLVAAATSGPIPSPAMRTILCAIGRQPYRAPSAVAPRARAAPVTRSDDVRQSARRRRPRRVLVAGSRLGRGHPRPRAGRAGRDGRDGPSAAVATTVCRCSHSSARTRSASSGASRSRRRCNARSKRAVDRRITWVDARRVRGPAFWVFAPVPSDGTPRCGDGLVGSAACSGAGRRELRFSRSHGVWNATQGTAWAGCPALHRDHGTWQPVEGTGWEGCPAARDAAHTWKAAPRPRSVRTGSRASPPGSPSSPRCRAGRRRCS